MSWKCVPGFLFVFFLLSHLRLWLTRSDWKQNRLGLYSAFIKHPYIKTKVMSLMEKVLTKRCRPIFYPWWQILATPLCLFHCKVLLHKLTASPSWHIRWQTMQDVCVFSYTLAYFSGATVVHMKFDRLTNPAWCSPSWWNVLVVIEVTL